MYFLTNEEKFQHFGEKLNEGRINYMFSKIMPNLVPNTHNYYAFVNDKNEYCIKIIMEKIDCTLD
jgi:hypothetical protein